MLDFTRFQKVQALVDGGATQGERAAALSRAEAIAAAAGMTYEQAVQASQGRFYSAPGTLIWATRETRPKRPNPPAWRGLTPDQRADWLEAILNRVTFKMSEPECRAIVAALEAIHAGGSGNLQDMPDDKRAMVRRVYKRAFNWGVRPAGEEAA